MMTKNKRIKKGCQTKVKEPVTKVEKKTLKNAKKDIVKKKKGSSKNLKSEKITIGDDIDTNVHENQNICEETPIVIQPPPAGLAYIPSSMFNIIVDSFEKEIDKFKKAFVIFINNNNIICNNALDWLEVDRFIHDYIKELMMYNKLDKFIIEYDMIDGMLLLIEYYKNDIYKDIFENEMEIFHYVKNNVHNTKYDMVYCIVKKMIGHESYENIMGF